jgi:hypothetical protein
MGYCEPDDINVGNLMLPEGESRQPFIDEASDEIDGKLGWLYQTPIDLDSLKYYERMMLKTICRKLAGGRMITTMAIPDESGSLNAYGARLLKEGLDELHAIASGDVPLSAARADLEGDSTSPDGGGHGAVGARTPSVSGHDSESLVAQFERSVYGGVPSYAVPGDAAPR